jgi:serine/threonine protein kinase
MSRVFLAFTPGGQPLAVKVIQPALKKDPQFTTRFAEEVRVAQKVDSGHVARLLDADPDAPRPWLASAYVPGPSLQELVTETGPLPTADALLLALGMAKALASIHCAGAVHRDLKPANVILDEAGPKVIDFGIAQRLTNPSTAEDGVVRIGTPGYMSPEQALGRCVAASSDVFSLGSTVYFLATGRGAFEAEHELATVHRTVFDEPELSGLDRRLRKVVEACLIKDPTRRATPVQVASLCLEALGPLAPGAYLNISQAAEAIRERSEALRELPPTPRHVPGAVEVGRRARQVGSATESGLGRPSFDATWSTQQTFPPGERATGRLRTWRRLCGALGVIVCATAPSAWRPGNRCITGRRT